MMKVFKAIIFFIIVLIPTVLIAAIIFLKTVDLNKYLPQITQEASKALGRPVTIEGVDLKLSFSGITLDVKNAVIADDPKASASLLIKVAGAHLALDMGPLITQRVLLVKSIDAKHASLTYLDKNPQMPLNIQVPDINVKINDFSLTKPFKFFVDASVLSKGGSNLYAQGEAAINLSKMGALLSGITIKTDLGRLDINQLAKVSPILAQIQIVKVLQGQLTMSIPTVEVSARGVSNLAAQVALSDGIVGLEPLLGQLTQIKAQADLDLKDIHLKALSLKVASGEVSLQGDLNDYLKTQSFKGQVLLSGIKLEELIDQKTLPVELKGNLAGKVDILGQGFAPESLYKNLKGAGELVISEGVIERMNIIKIALGSTLGAIPGLADQVDNLITGALKEKLGADTTVLEKAGAKFTIEEGILHLDDAIVSSKVFDFLAQGTMDYQLSLDMQTKLHLSADASEAIAYEIKELGYLMGDDKRIAISAKITGTVPALTYKPDVDLKRIGANVLAEEGAKQLQKVIEKNPEVGAILNAVFGNKESPSDNADSQGPTDNATQSQEKTKKLISDVLGNFLK